MCCNRRNDTQSLCKGQKREKLLKVFFLGKWYDHTLNKLTFTRCSVWWVLWQVLDIIWGGGGERRRRRRRRWEEEEEEEREVEEGNTMNINVFTDHPIYNNRLHLTIAENSWVHFIFIKHTPRGKPTRWILFHSIDKEATSCHVMHIHLQYNSTFKAGALNLSLSVFLTCTLSPHSSPFLSFFSSVTLLH